MFRVNSPRDALFRRLRNVSPPDPAVSGHHPDAAAKANHAAQPKRPESHHAPDRPFRNVHSRSPRRELSQIPGNIHHYNPLIPFHQQQQLEQLHPLIMQRILPPMPYDKFGQEHCHLPPGILLLQLQDVIH